MNLNTKRLLLSIVIGFNIATSIDLATSENEIAEKYEDYDGNVITQDQYEERLAHCWSLKSDNAIDDDVDCESWVLTKEGNDRLLKLVIEESLED